MLRATCLALILVATGCATGCATVQRDRTLPLTKLRLYETGVGYYERAGELGGLNGASLPVPSGHLDDALKSLVILGEDGLVRSVAFDSRQSPAVARTRAGLPPESDAPIRVHDVLIALRGHELVVRCGRRRTRGRLVDVIGVPDAAGLEVYQGEDAEGPSNAEQAGAVPDKTFALLVTNEGAYRQVDVATIDEVTPIDADVRARMRAALDADVALHSNNRGQLELEGEGASVRIGYLAESPVWRANYRMVLGPNDTAALQGWALVHNDTEENWDDVTIELVNGRPDSFLFPLAAPRYERRELVTPERELSSVPQLLDTTPDAMWGDFLDSDDTSYGYGGGTGSGYGSGSGGGFGGRGARGGRIGIRTGASSLLAVGNLAELAAGQGRETKTAFVYGSREPLDLGAGRSALVPFLQSEVDSRAITWFSGFGTDTARHAILVLNDTDQTLPEGTLGVFGDGGFSGETVLPRLKPGQRRFLEIGDDPDTEMTVASRASSELPKQLVYHRGALQEHFVRTTTIVFDLVNLSGQARHVYVEVAAGSNTTIEGAERLDFDVDRGQPLAIFELGPNARVEGHEIVIQEGLSRSTSVDALEQDRLEQLSTAASLTDAERVVMKTALGRLAQQGEAQDEVTRASKEITTLEADIARLRGHLQAMGGEGVGGDASPLVERLLRTEDQLLAQRELLEQANAVLAERIESTREGLAALAAAP